MCPVNGNKPPCTVLDQGAEGGEESCALNAIPPNVSFLNSGSREIHHVLVFYNGTGNEKGMGTGGVAFG